LVEKFPTVLEKFPQVVMGEFFWHTVYQNERGAYFILSQISNCCPCGEISFTHVPQKELMCRAAMLN